MLNLLYVAGSALWISVAYLIYILSYNVNRSFHREKLSILHTILLHRVTVCVYGALFVLSIIGMIYIYVNNPGLQV